MVCYGTEGAAAPVVWYRAKGNVFMWPVFCSGETGHGLSLWLWGGCCCIKAAIPCVVPGSECIWGWASLISRSHASDWFVLLTDSCDNEVIVRRQSVHRNVFMSCGLGSWAFYVLRGSVSSWLGQSKGWNMKWLYKKNPCCFLISALGASFAIALVELFAVVPKQEFSKPFFVPLKLKIPEQVH